MSTEQSEVNIREVAPDVWTFSAPFTRSGLVPMGNRTTAIKLKSGSVWVLPSTPLDSPTKAKLNELGPVAYIVSGDSDHHMYLADYHAEYSSAKIVVNSMTAEQDSKKGLPFFGVFGKDAPNTQYGFEPEIEHVYFSGHRKGDVAFFHSTSRSLLVQDLLFNQPAKDEHNESYAKSDQSGHVPFQEKLFQPFSGLHQTMVNLLGKEQETMEKDVRKVSSWDFDRVITCHGNIIETGGKDAWNTAFAKFVQQ